MSDSDTPEQSPKEPKGPQPGGIWRAYNEKRARLGSSDQNSLAEPPPETSEDIASIENDPMKMAARKCAQMEEELAELLQSKINPNPDDIITTVPTGIQGLLIKGGSEGTLSIESLRESVGVPDKLTPIRFFVYPHTNEIDTTEAKRLGIETNKKLIIEMHSDEPTREAYEESVKERWSFASTTYYFTSKGDMGKVSRIPVDVSVDPNRPILIPSNKFGSANVYESEMTPHDFEIAGQAITMLIDKVRQVTGTS